MTILTETQSLHFPCGSVRVGDVFASCWGYEQTNVNFYQVVAVRGKKTAVLREIRGNTIASEDRMIGEKSPLLDHFIDEPIVKRILTTCSRPFIKISDGEGYAYKTSPDVSHSVTSYA